MAATVAESCGRVLQARTALERLRELADRRFDFDLGLLGPFHFGSSSHQPGDLALFSPTRTFEQQPVLVLGVLALEDKDPFRAIELLNSAVENIVDRIGHELNELSGRAKDMGSAAVLISLLMTGLAWIAIGWKNFASWQGA